MSIYSRKKLISGFLVTSLVLASGIPAMAAPKADVIKRAAVTKPLSTPNVKKGSTQISASGEAKKTGLVKQVPSVSSEKESGYLKNKEKFASGAGKSAAPRSYVPGELIIKFRDGLSVNSLGSDAESLNLKTVKKLGTHGAQLLKIDGGKSVEEAVRLLKASKSVEYVQPNYKIYANDVTDPKYPQLWGMKNTGQSILGVPGTAGVDINAEAAWTTTKGKQDLVVAVIDTGVDINHPDLKNNIWTNTKEIPGNGIDDDHNGFIDDVNGWDFYHSDNTVFDPFDGDEHGTHTSGTIAGVANNIGVIGVASNVKIMPLKFLGPNGGDTAGAIEAVNYAASMGVKLSNNSWGGGSYNQALADAIAKSGMLFVASAGNSNLNVDISPSYPAAYDVDNILSVASITNTGAKSSFSNFGTSSVDVAAPGSNVYSTVPRKVETGASLEIQQLATSGSTYNAIVQGFGLQEIGDVTKRKDLAEKALAKMGVAAGDSILLVQDDQHDADPSYFPDYLNQYKDALSSYLVDTVTVATDAIGPDLATMQARKAVLWFTGHSFGNNEANLTSMDTSNLESYLTAGGKLYLSGPDILYGNEESNLVQNMLHVAVISDGDKRKFVKGTANTAYASATYNLDGVVEKYHDQLTTTNPTNAVVDLVWPEEVDYSDAYEYFSGTSMAAPHATGAAALVMSAHPEFTPVQVKNALMKTVTPLSSMVGMVKSEGMINAAAALNFEPDNDIPGVQLNGNQVTGTLDQTNDLDDVYAVHLKRGEKLKVKMTGQADTDFDLYLYGSFANTVKNSEGIIKYSETPGTSTEQIEFVPYSDGTYYIDAYGYAGSGSYTLIIERGAQAGTYENDAPELSYNGYWNTNFDPNASGGSYAVADHNEWYGMNAEFVFYGAGIQYIAQKGPQYGIAKVTVDGQIQNVSLFASAVQNQAVAFEKTGLPVGTHTLKIEYTGLSDRLGRKTATSINIDALKVPEVDTTPPAAPTGLAGTLTADNHASLTWNANTESDLAGYLVLRGEGTSPTQFAIVTPDPITTTSFVDKSVSIDKAYSYKIVAVDKAGNKSIASANQVTVQPPVVTPTTTVVEETDPKIVYNPAWTSTTDAQASGGSLRYTNTTGAYAEFTFDGTGIQVLSMKNAYRGFADIYLDDMTTPVATVDLYSATTAYKSVIFVKQGLTNTSHKIKIVTKGTKNATSNSTHIALDAFVVTKPQTTATPYKVENNDPKVSYNPAWQLSTDAQTSGGNLSYTNATGAYAEFSFTGKGIKVFTMKNAYRGLADVYVDNMTTPVATVDLYSATTLYNEVLFSKSDLSNSDHKIRIVCKGTKNTSSNSTHVAIDAFEVTP